MTNTASLYGIFISLSKWYSQLPSIVHSTLITVVPSMMLLIFLVYFFIVWPINKAIGEIKSHAQLIAVFKYIGTKEDDPRRRISDDMVQYHVPDTIKDILNNGGYLQKWSFFNTLNNEFPKLYELILARTVFYDSQIQRYLSLNHVFGQQGKRIEQIVIIGAGYSSLASNFRQNVIENNISVFEIDNQSIQAAKLALIEKLDLQNRKKTPQSKNHQNHESESESENIFRPPANTRYVSLNYADETNDSAQESDQDKLNILRYLLRTTGNVDGAHNDKDQFSESSEDTDDDKTNHHSSASSLHKRDHQSPAKNKNSSSSSSGQDKQSTQTNSNKSKQNKYNDETLSFSIDKPTLFILENCSFLNDKQLDTALQFIGSQAAEGSVVFMDYLKKLAKKYPDLHDGFEEFTAWSAAQTDGKIKSYGDSASISRYLRDINIGIVKAMDYKRLGLLTWKFDGSKYIKHRVADGNIATFIDCLTAQVGYLPPLRKKTSKSSS